MNRKKSISTYAVGLLLIIVLTVVSFSDYLLFHTIAELFSITVAWCIFMIAWNSREIAPNTFYIVLGAAYLCVGGVDLAHALAFQGMPFFPSYDANLPTQLWIGARYLESLSLVAALLLMRQRVNAEKLLLLYGGCFILIIAATFGKVFPDCYIEGVGLTRFKIISEYIICLILIGGAGLLLKHRTNFDPHLLRLLLASILLTIAAELAFTFYVSVYGLSNLIGHWFKLGSFCLIYLALIEHNLRGPYGMLFRELKRYEIMVDRIADPLSWVDRNYVYHAVNRAYSEYAKRPRADIIGTSVAQLVGKGLFEREVRQRLDRCFAGEEVHYQAWFDLPDASPKYMDVGYYPLTEANGEITGAVVSSRDITDLKQIEAQLSENEKRYQKAQQLGQVGNWEYNIQTDTFWGSDEAKRIYGFDPQSIQFSTDEIERCIPDRERVHQALIDLIEHNKPYNLEFDIITKDTTERKTIVSIAELERDAKGTPLKITGVIHDITKRKQMEEASRISSAKYKTLFETIPVGISVTDEHGNILEANDESQRLLGVGKEVHTQRRIDGPEWRIVRSDGSPMPAAEYASARALKTRQQVNQVEIGIIRENQETTWINVSAAPIPLSGYGVIVVYNDITARKQAEAALRESEEKFQKSFHACPVVMSISTLAEGIFLDVNAEFLKLSGLCREEVVGHRSTAIPLWNKRAERDEIIAEINEKGYVHGKEVELRTKDGTIIPLLWYGDVVHINYQPCLIASGYDLTDRKRAEIKLQQYAAHLEEMVAARTQALEKAQAELLIKERLAVLGYFAGSLSHEIRNPLAVIDSSAYFLNMKLGGDEKLGRHLAHIRKNVENINVIIESLLNLTRLENPKTQRTELGTLVFEILSSAEIPDTVVTAFNSPGAEVMVGIDPEQLRMALKNVIKNAIQAMNNAGTLTVSIRRLETGETELAVADTGPGIPPEYLEKIFEPLFTTKTQGIGFGLSIAKMVMEKHGGTVRAESAPGKGGCLRFIFPLQKP